MALLKLKIFAGEQEEDAEAEGLRRQVRGSYVNTFVLQTFSLVFYLNKALHPISHTCTVLEKSYLEKNNVHSALQQLKYRGWQEPLFIEIFHIKNLTKS